MAIKTILRKAHTTITFKSAEDLRPKRRSQERGCRRCRTIKPATNGRGIATVDGGVAEPNLIDDKELVVAWIAGARFRMGTPLFIGADLKSEMQRDLLVSKLLRLCERCSWRQFSPRQYLGLFRRLRAFQG
jgi:hypothetical protein